MKKVYLTLLALAVLVFLIVMALPVQAGPPQEAGGLWQYTPTIVGVKAAGCNTIYTTTEISLWTGTFTGDSTEAGTVTFHCSGRVSFNGIATLDPVTVDGRSGTLVMSVNGFVPELVPGVEWEGNWVILSGTGDLENLRGQGTWWGPGSQGPGTWGDIYYEGSVHFEPN